MPYLNGSIFELPVLFHSYVCLTTHHTDILYNFIVNIVCYFIRHIHPTRPLEVPWLFLDFWPFTQVWESACNSPYQTIVIFIGSTSSKVCNLKPTLYSWGISNLSFYTLLNSKITNILMTIFAFMVFSLVGLWLSFLELPFSGFIKIDPQYMGYWGFFLYRKWLPYWKFIHYEAYEIKEIRSFENLVCNTESDYFFTIKKMFRTEAVLWRINIQAQKSSLLTHNFKLVSTI